jgi:hypothetical protein
MEKLVLMSTFLVPVLMALRFSKASSPRNAMRRTMIWTLAFLVLWALFGPKWYLRLL